MKMSGAAELSGNGVVAYEPGRVSVDMTMDFNGQQLQMLMVDKRIYVADDSTGGKYQEIPQDNPAFGQLRQQMESMDVETSFDAWEAGLKEVEYVGEDEFDGETTDQYDLTVDMKAASEAMGQQVQPGMPDSLTYDLWLIEEDLMRRVSFEVMGGEMVLDMTAWNEPVDIEAPSGDELVQR